ncbi:hypothetical protein GQ53DRAFT_863349 [Thozetella sp. PMI_491]|nr:hypothetical protein GQ53DRAFT_863349 [Thozetella sp. PMI_491]
MSVKKHSRQYDLVLLGATGYTGTLTAEHITANLPPDLKWAVAGRSEAKLKQLVSDCQALQPNRVQPAIEVCDVNDKELSALAGKTFCLITTLGPYSRYGEYAFKACAEAGTHYIDSTGEVPFTLDMIKKYEATAKASGAWMFPQSALESAPSDLLTWALVSTIRSKLSAQTSEVVMDLHRLDSAPSGGTLASFMSMMEVYPTKALMEITKPYALSPVRNDHVPKKSLVTSITGMVNVPGLGLLSTSPTGVLNAALVSRTWGLTKQEPSLQKEFYGPKFTYQEFMKTSNILTGVAMHYSLLGGVTMLMIPPFRSLMRKFVFKPGEGPDKIQAKKDVIEFRAVAKPDPESEASKRAFGRLSYTGMTALLMAQGAATILYDETVILTGGIFTPACLGQGFIDRIRQAGVEFETEIREVQ